MQNIKKQFGRLLRIACITLLLGSSALQGAGETPTPAEIAALASALPTEQGERVATVLLARLTTLTGEDLAACITSTEVGHIAAQLAAPDSRKTTCAAILNYLENNLPPCLFVESLIESLNGLDTRSSGTGRTEAPRSAEPHDALRGFTLYSGTLASSFGDISLAPPRRTTTVGGAVCRRNPDAVGAELTVTGFWETRWPLSPPRPPLLRFFADTRPPQ